MDRKGVKVVRHASKWLDRRVLPIHPHIEMRSSVSRPPDYVRRTFIPSQYTTLNLKNGKHLERNGKLQSVSTSKRLHANIFLSCACNRLDIHYSHTGKWKHPHRSLFIGKYIWYTDISMLAMLECICKSVELSNGMPTYRIEQNRESELCSVVMYHWIFFTDAIMH